VGKIAKKNSLKECVFVNLPLKIQYHIVKSTLSQTAFSAISLTYLEFHLLSEKQGTSLSFGRLHEYEAPKLTYHGTRRASTTSWKVDVIAEIIDEYYLTFAKLLERTLIEPQNVNYNSPSMSQ